MHARHKTLNSPTTLTGLRQWCVGMSIFAAIAVAMTWKGVLRRTERCTHRPAPNQQTLAGHWRRVGSIIYRNINYWLTLQWTCNSMGWSRVPVVHFPTIRRSFKEQNMKKVRFLVVLACMLMLGSIGTVPSTQSNSASFNKCPCVTSDGCEGWLDVDSECRSCSFSCPPLKAK